MTSQLTEDIDYGSNVTEVSTKDFDPLTGNLINFSKGITVVSFGSKFARFSLSMQADFKKFADYAITNKQASNILWINVLKNNDILTLCDKNKWPFTLKEFPRNIFYADGKPCYVHDTDYTYKSFMDSLNKVNVQNPQCKLD